MSGTGLCLHMKGKRNLELVMRKWLHLFVGGVDSDLEPGCSGTTLFFNIFIDDH
jgi:hypothetical protein